MEGESEVVCCCLHVQQQGVLTVFKSDRTLRSCLVGLKIPSSRSPKRTVSFIRFHVNVAKYISEKQGRERVNERMKEHEKRHTAYSADME